MPLGLQQAWVQAVAGPGWVVRALTDEASCPALQWPGGRNLAVVPLIVLESYEDPLPPGWPQVRSVGGGLAREFPNISRVSTREYGHRVGIFRLLDALRRHGIRPTVAIDALTAEDYPDLVDVLRADGAEFVAHGLSVTRPQTSAMTLQEER
ncbi:MAG: hypothetical protein ACOVQT_14040, partial [Rubrivivax sp.]